MKPKKEDRRVRLTKRAIRDSLLELMAERPIAKISVKLICERADINRSTFYAHYTDQYDLLHQVQQELLEGFKAQLFSRQFTQQSGASLPMLVEVMEYARKNADLFRVLLGEGGDATFRGELMAMVQHKTLQEIRDDKRLEPRMTHYLEIFSIYGCVSILREWLKGGCVDEPAIIAEMIHKLLFQGLLAFYR